MVHGHIVVITFPAQGAINPSIQFAKNLIRMGVKVTILASTSVHRRMTKTSSPSPTPQGLTFAAFSDGFDDGFKLSHNPAHFMSEFKSRGSKALSELIMASTEQGKPVTGVVYGMMLTWAAEVAHSFNIPSAVLWIQPATVFDIYYYYFTGYGDTIRNISHDSSCPIDLPGLPRLTSRDLPSYLVPSNSISIGIGVPGFKEQLEALDAEANPKILVNTFDALELEALRATEKYNLVAIGPLVPSAFLDGKDPSDAAFGADLLQKSRGYVQWLDSKPRSSVVYVSFGSFFILTMQQMEEIARGLLESHRPFLWVIRATENGEKQEDKLSCKDELEKQGMIVSWCSQVEVLSHPSLGCFVTHCGWNSSLESLVCGIPVVGLPQFTDQPTNAKLLEDAFQTGVRATVSEEGIVEAEEIRRCIEVVIGDGESGKEIRRNAKKWMVLAKEAVKEGGSSDVNLRAFVDEVERGF